jgi:hypothetical protein
MRTHFTFDELEAFKQNIPTGIEFPIEYRKGDGQTFSVDKGLFDTDVVALVCALQQKLYLDKGLLQDPLTNYGRSQFDDDGDYVEKNDSLFHAIKWVWYDDKNETEYKLYFDKQKLTFLGERMIDSLIKSNFMMSLGIGDAENASAVFGCIGEF